MPLNAPSIDSRRYQDLLDEALARVPVHNPEWTNFNKSDPGVTLIELFAFLTESLLYRANQIPERNRQKFLELLGVPLQPAASAQGLVSFAQERGPLAALTLSAGLELRAGAVPFRTTRGLDVLPIEARVFFKRGVAPPEGLLDYYRELYASYLEEQPDLSDVQIYETLPLEGRGESGVNLAEETIDGALWVALLLRAGDQPAEASREAARRAIAGKTLTLGIVPALDEREGRLAPAGAADAESSVRLLFELPSLPADRLLPPDRRPRYIPLDAAASGDVLREPGVVELTLPGDPGRLALWENLDPLEAGVDDFPPTLEDSALAARLLTWLRVRPAVTLRPSSLLRIRILWAGINAAPVSQRAEVSGELLPEGTGEPDQRVTLARRPVLPDSVRLSVTAGGLSEEWQPIDDLGAAGPEVPVPDPRLPPGAPAPSADLPSNVFSVDPEAGLIRFGDGVRGRRPPRGAALRASYAYGAGREGNVGPGAIDSAPALGASLAVSNPVRTWGGADAEQVADGERQIARFLRHRDRLVSADDFATITWRTPGVELGRVEVLPAFHPALSPNEPGDAPGAVTVMVIPRYDAARPDAPLPDRPFIDAVCAHLGPRRLVTTEVFVRGPTYKDLWISVGIGVVAGWSVAQVREEVRRALLGLLAPLPVQPGPPPESDEAPDPALWGWPLRRAVVDRELMVVAGRVRGVLQVGGLLLAEGGAAAAGSVTMSGLELPRVAGISVAVGEPLPLDDLRGLGAGTADPGGARRRRLPVPALLEECG